MLSIAFVQGDSFRAMTLRRNLDRLGHTSVLYDHPAELLEVLRTDRRFDLLIFAHDDEPDWQAISAWCRTPVLLIVREFDWTRLPDGTRAFIRAGGLVDAVAWPLSDEELTWRLHALLQRVGPPAAPPTETDDLVWRDYRFLTGTRVVLHRGEEVRLNAREYDLALFLFRYMEQTLTRDQLWNVLCAGRTSRVLDVRMSIVRKKLQLNGEHGLELRAVYRVGYKLMVSRGGSLEAERHRSASDVPVDFFPSARPMLECPPVHQQAMM